MDESNLYLVGPMLSGKTTISKILGPRMGREIFETDTEIERLVGMDIPAIFSKYGEPHFRDLETQILHAASVRRNLIVSTGGGVVIRPENRAIMHTTGEVIWIDVALSVLLERRTKKAEQADRPLAGNLESLYVGRRLWYQVVADYVVRVDVEAPAEEISERVLKTLSEKQ